MTSAGWLCEEERGHVCILPRWSLARTSVPLCGTAVLQILSRGDLSTFVTDRPKPSNGTGKTCRGGGMFQESLKARYINACRCSNRYSPRVRTIGSRGHPGSTFQDSGGNSGHRYQTPRAETLHCWAHHTFITHTTGHSGIPAEWPAQPWRKSLPCRAGWAISPQREQKC